MLQLIKNLSHYEPLDPHMNDSDGEERVEAGGDSFPAHDQAAVLPLEPGKRPLGLEARDVLFHGAPTRLSRLPHPFGDLGPDTTGAEAMTEVLACMHSRPPLAPYGGGIDFP